MIIGNLAPFVAPILAKTERFGPMLRKSVNLFQTGGYSMERWWYIKLPAQDFLVFTLCAAMAIVTLRYSAKLFLISFIWGAYVFADMAWFWYNYNEGYFGRWSVTVCSVATILVAIIRIKPIGKYKSMI